MLKVAVENGYGAYIFMGQHGVGRAHDQIDDYPGVGGVLNFLDYFAVGQMVDLQEDIALLSLGLFLGNHLAEGFTHIEGRNQEMAEFRRG